MNTYRILYEHIASGERSTVMTEADSYTDALYWFDHPEDKGDWWRLESDIIHIEQMTIFTVCYIMITDDKHYVEIPALTGAEARKALTHKFPDAQVQAVLLPVYISDGSDYVAR